MKKISVLALLLVIVMTLSSCIVSLPPAPNPPQNEGTDPIKDAEIKDELDEWGNDSSIITTSVAKTVIKGQPTDLSALVGEDFNLEGASWVSACEGIATVDSNGTVTGVKYGRTNNSVGISGMDAIRCA